MRKIMAGAVYTEDRAARHFKRGSPIFPFCGKTEETRDHLFWECEHWGFLRKDVLAVLPTAPKAMPNCLRLCGLLRAKLAEGYRPHLGQFRSV